MSQAKAKGFFPVKGSKGAYILRPQKVSFPDLDANGIQQKIVMDLLRWFNLLSQKLVAYLMLMHLKVRSRISKEIGCT